MHKVQEDLSWSNTFARDFGVMCFCGLCTVGFGLFASLFQGLSKLASNVVYTIAIIQHPVLFATATIEVLSSLQPVSGPKDLTVAEAKQLLPSKPFGNPHLLFRMGGPWVLLSPPGTPNVLLDLCQS